MRDPVTTAEVGTLLTVLHHLSSVLDRRSTWWYIRPISSVTEPNINGQRRRRAGWPERIVHSSCVLVREMLSGPTKVGVIPNAESCANNNPTAQ